MNAHKWIAAGAACLLAVGLAACEKNTQPSGGFDATAVQADVDAVSNIYASSAWTSFSAISGGTTSAPITAAFEAARATAGLGAGDASARSLLSAVPRGGVRPNVPVIPAELLGKTLVYDDATDLYVVDPARAGAPPNGVRYVLYAVNPVTKEPVVSSEIGHADLTDEGVSILNGFRLRVLGVTGTLTFIDYNVTVTGTPTSGNITANGFLTDGVNRLNYNVAMVGSVSAVQNSLSLTYSLDVANVGFTASGSISGTGTPADSTVSFTQTVVAGGANFQITATATTHTFAATVNLNGAVFARASGTPAAITITDADGNPLSLAEYAALGDIMAVSGAVTLTTIAILAPAGFAIAGGHPAS